MGSFTINAENNTEATASGDVNSDGEFNSDDVIAIQKYLVNAGSFIDIAGNNVNVQDNTGYRNGNENIVAAFELHEQVNGWGYHCTFTDNTLYMDQPYGAVYTSRRMYVADGWYSDFSVKNNKVDYGNGLTLADSWEYYNSDYVTYLE